MKMRGDLPTALILYNLILMAEIRGLGVLDVVEVPQHLDVIVLQSSQFLGSPTPCGKQHVAIQGVLISCRPFISTAYNTLDEISKYSGQTLTVMHPENTSSFYKILDEAIQLTNQPGMYFRWNPTYILQYPVVFEDYEDVVKLLQHDTFRIHIHNLQIKTNLYILAIFRNGEFSVSEVYTVVNITFQNLLPFTSNHGTLNYLSLTNNIIRRSDFQGAEISAAAANDPLFALETKFTPDEKMFESGLAVQRFWFIRDGLNFTERAVVDGWTSEDKNGSLVGSGVLVMNGQIDLGIAQTPMTQSKKTHIDFLQPTDERILKIFFIQPKSSQYRNIYLASFEPSLWLTIVGVWIGLFLLIRVIVLFKSHVCFESIPDDHKFVGESFIWVFGTATQHSWHILPSSFSIRIIHLVSHMTGFLCFTAFTASIVAFLSVKSSPLKSIDDIMNASFKIYSNDNSTPIMLVLPILEAQSGYPDKVIINEEISIPRAMTPGSQRAVVAFAYVLSIEARTLNLTDAMICQNLNYLPVAKVPLRHGMIVRKGSAYREFLNHQIMLMTERGFNHRFKLTYTRGTEAICLDYSLVNHVTLGFDDVMSASVILLSGCALAVLFLIIEKLSCFKVQEINI